MLLVILIAGKTMLDLSLHLRERERNRAGIESARRSCPTSSRVRKAQRFPRRRRRSNHVHRFVRHRVIEGKLPCVKRDRAKALVFERLAE